MKRAAAIGGIGLGAALLAAAWLLVDRQYLRPAAELRADIGEKEAMIRQVEAQMTGRERVLARAEALGATMIAGEPDEVEHRLREGLTEVARRASLTGVALGNGKPSGQRSPVPRAIGRSALARSLGGADFDVVRGWMTGTGTPEQVWLCLALLEAQPWVHRIEGFSVTPADEARSRFKLRADFATIVSGAVARTVTDTRALAEPPAEALAAVASIAEARPFGGPVATPETVVVQAAPPGPGYEDWRVTGLIESDGVEAMLVNAATGERAVLAPGQGVLEARFQGGAGERAVFVIDGQEHEVTVGQTLADRRRLGGGGVQARKGEVGP